MLHHNNAPAATPKTRLAPWKNEGSSAITSVMPENIAAKPRKLPGFEKVSTNPLTTVAQRVRRLVAQQVNAEADDQHAAHHLEQLDMLLDQLADEFKAENGDAGKKAIGQHGADAHQQSRDQAAMERAVEAEEINRTDRRAHDHADAETCEDLRPFNQHG